jgi:hypothetical protein
MRKTLILLVALLTIGGAFLSIRYAATVAAAAPEKDRPRCEHCNMFWDISTTRIEASIKSGGKTATHLYESLGCLQQSVASGDTLTSVKILDYATASGKSPKLIDAKKAHYLFETTTRLKGSMAPFIAAFSSKEAAVKAQKELGGEYMTWEQAWKKLGAPAGKTTAAAGGSGCACCAPKSTI